jgi:hypothetical protein
MSHRDLSELIEDEDERRQAKRKGDKSGRWQPLKSSVNELAMITRFAGGQSKSNHCCNALDRRQWHDQSITTLVDRYDHHIAYSPHQFLIVRV